MDNLKNIITSLHKSTPRDYKARMLNDKIHCMEIAKKYEYDYWDGDRKYGYNGYKYIPSLWKPAAEKIIKTYNLTNESSILDLGCGKAFLLLEIKLLLPNIKIIGVDIYKHAINSVSDSIKPYLINLDTRNKLPFKNQEFNLVFSLGNN